MTMTWWVLGGVAGVFAIVCVLGMWVTCSRHRRYKQVQKLRTQRASMGRYVKLEDKDLSFEEELHPSPETDLGNTTRGRGSSHARQPPSRGRDRHQSNGDLEAQRSRNPRIVPDPDALMLEARSSNCRGISPASKLLSLHNEQQEIFLPPPSHSRDQSRNRSLSREIEYTAEHQLLQCDRTRSASPASFVLSRNASMLQSRSSSPSPYPQR